MRAPHLRPASALVIASALVLAALAGCSSDSGGAATGPGPSSTTTAPAKPKAASSPVQPAAKIEGPITGGKYDLPYLAMPEGWKQKYRYTEQEYFLSGDATSYASATDLTVDGRWDAEPTGKTAPYKTRIVVRRPKDDADFNGTVVVEWLNVSAGRDSDPDFGFLADELMRKGYAYVAVSAQKTGVEPGGLGIDIPGVPKAALAPLKEWDPERYGSLSHPGDQYSYDIFGQAAQTALRTGKGTPLGDLDVQKVIATGESQSAFRMVTYVDAIQPTSQLFDGFLIHSRGADGAALNDAKGQAPPVGTQIRTDHDVPVLQFETETDLGYLGFVKARQADDDHLVTWETAGTAHVDRSSLDYGVLAGHNWTDVNVDLSQACGQVNEGPQQPVVQKAFDSLHTWVVDGTKPAQSPRIDTDAGGTIVRDGDGIATGGIRTPAVDAPTATHTGTNPSSSVICVLFGSTTPFTQAQLDAHYADHDAYVQQVTASADRAVTEGFLLRPAADQMIAEAQKSDVP
ncbi:alpha/beta hydrolase domain-containing protein [Aquihabitans sp. McL0605]|uniref:alpha/beta hydrolase domain-containing protein n=1 Tax=Aquihabitans sp. McL0605 TaxID=3415671 RepID=UPI003CEBF30E